MISIAIGEHQRGCSTAMIPELSYAPRVHDNAELDVKPFEPHDFTDEDDRAATEWQQAAGRRLTKKCRAGVPEVFRGGVWNKVMSPTMEEAGTPSHKVRHLCSRRDDQ